jgi:hypothetical protein
MKLVMTLLVDDAADVVDAQIAYHLNAGVDLVLAAGSAAASTEILERYERDGALCVVRPTEDEVHTRMAREAATEHGADWVINLRAGEFWWPRAESLKDVLAAIPPRYTIVQGLLRQFVPRAGVGDSFAERMTQRRSLQNATDAGPALLRPVHRADPTAVVEADGTVRLARTVPLRAWYPLEVLHFPATTADGSTGEGELVLDTRLRDALRTLRDPGARLTFSTPDIVDDAAYAVECAAVGEVDLPGLEAYIAELEQRVAWLEQRFWPRVLRQLTRLARS